MQEIGHRYEAYNESYRIRAGQSLYNFEIDDYDIGVYGSVFLFSQYLKTLEGDDVYTNLYDYFVNSYSSTFCDAEGLANAVSSNVYQQIDSSVSYGSGISFISEEEEWLSKLTLNFYVASLRYDNFDPQEFSKIETSKLLYDSLDDATIEGGGRIIVAVKDGKYEIPADASSGLIYIGFDQNFNMVTNVVQK